MADAGALHAVRLLSSGLPATKADPDDLDARLECQQAVGLACAGLNRVPYGASRGLGHQLGAVFAMSHGHTSCVMMPHVMAHNLPATREAQRLIAEAMGRPDVPASMAVGELVARLGLPTRLRDAGATRELLPTIADGRIAHPWITATRSRSRPPTTCSACSSTPIESTSTAPSLAITIASTLATNHHHQPQGVPMQIETHLLNEFHCFRYPSADATYALVVSHGLGGHGGIYNTSANITSRRAPSCGATTHPATAAPHPRDRRLTPGITRPQTRPE